MDLTMGMRCPSCKKHNKFYGGTFGRVDGSMVNYNCACGFSATLVIPNKGYEGFEIRFVKDSKD